MLNEGGVEYLKSKGWSDDKIERVFSGKKVEEKKQFTYTMPLDEFRKKMRELGWDDEDIENEIALAEELAPLQNNIVNLKSYLIPRKDLGELYA